MDFSMLVLSGAILAVGIIVPGISASFILLYLGTYEGILKGLATGAFDVLTPVGIGFLAAAVLCVKALAYLFEHYHEYAYYTSLGLLLGSMLLIFPPPGSGFTLLLDLVVLLGGFLVVFCFERKKERR